MPLQTRVPACRLARPSPISYCLLRRYWVDTNNDIQHRVQGLLDSIFEEAVTCECFFSL